MKLTFELLFFREKTCTARLQKWGLSTYRTRARQASQNAPKEPSRKRRGRSLQRKKKNSIPTFSTSQVIAPNPTATSLIQPNAYRPHEVVLHSADHLIYSIFGSKLGFTHKELIYPNIGGSNNYRMLWWEIADLYHTARIYWGDIEFTEKIQKAHSELHGMVHDLVSCSEDVPLELKQGRYLVVISIFWRICHKLIRKDRLWGQHGYVLVYDFLMYFSGFVYVEYREEHPLCKLLDALFHIPWADIEVILRLGAIRTIERMTSGLYVKRKMVLRCWTDFL